MSRRFLDVDIRMRTGFTCPVTSNLTERVNVNYSADHFGATGGGCVTHVAIQRWLGLLPERRAGSRSCDFARSGTNRASLAQA
jgi:hypothetical protein